MRNPSVHRDQREVLCLSPRGFDHHFTGLAPHLASRGLHATLETLQLHAPLRVTPSMAQHAGLILHADAVHTNAAGIRAAATAAGTPLCLLMDGITDHANSFLNPRAGHDFLRPVPADLTLAAGSHDRDILRALGNPALATGLPRLAAFADRAHTTPARTRRGVLIASANTPAFTRGGRERLLRAYAQLLAAAEHSGIPIRWRIAPELAHELNVPRDQDPLAESLAASQALITPASTLALEAMLAGVPTALVHPHPWPLWLPAAWIWHANHLARNAACLQEGWEEDTRRVSALDGADAKANAAAAHSAKRLFHTCAPFEAASAQDLLAAVLTPSAELLALQQRIRRRCTRHNAAENVARVLSCIATKAPSAHTLRTQRPRVDVQALPAPRTPDQLPPPHTRRVVCCIEDHASSVGGVSVWSARMEAHFAAHPEFNLEWITMFISAGRVTPTERLADRPHACMCPIDPTASTLHMRTSITNALRALDASVIIPNYGCHAFGAALHARAHGAVVLAIAHTNDDYYRRLLADFDQWDAAVAVSPECRRWVEPLAGNRPVRTIIYGVPLGPLQASHRPHGPLRLGYVGRVVEKQKRVSDLLRLLQELHRRGMPFEFHMVGDGEALEAWSSAAATLRLPAGTLHIHGPRHASWVQDFWPTLDLNIITSDAEGTSIAMLESMAAGVVPCITRVDHAIDELLADGQNAIIVPVGDMSGMADRIVALHADRALLQRMGASARNVIIHRGLTIDACAHHYRELLDTLFTTPAASRPPTAFAGGLAEPNMLESFRGAAFEDDLESHLRAGGFDPIHHSSPSTTIEHTAPSSSLKHPSSATPQHTAILIRGHDPHPGPEAIAAWRAQGLAVAVAPSLSADSIPHLTSLVYTLRDQGLNRLALFAPGHFNTAAAEWLARNAREILVGVIVPGAPEHSTYLGLPGLSLERAIAIHPQGVVHAGRPDDLATFAAAHPLRMAEIPLYPALDQPAPTSHIDALLALCIEDMHHGQRTATTAPFPLLPGMHRVDVPTLAASTQPCRLILPGDETDFEHAAFLHPTRTSSIRVHSLRWSDAELHSPERFARIVRELARDTDNSAPPLRYAIFGSGLHTRRLLRHGTPPLPPACILDDRAQPGAMLEQVPVVTPDQYARFGIASIILSSPAHEAAFWRKTALLREAGIRVVPLYHSTEQLSELQAAPA